ncbi:MAG TPA: hypothetical protein VGG62_13005 [Terracidiphilus sp.]|jgi:hypothetical protein
MPSKNNAPLGRGAGTVVSVAFAGYLQGHPNWATDHPTVAECLYIAALISAVYLFVSFILRWKWGQWIFGISAHLYPEQTSSPSAQTPEYKLKILSAEYGAEKSIGRVEKYLLKHATDALYVRVNAHLFDGYDPASGLEKQLKVVYSYDHENEHTAICNEHDLLVIPENPEIADLFCPLQLTAFRIAKDIFKFLANFEDIPPIDHRGSDSQKRDAIRLRGEWRTKLSSSFNVRFRSQIDRLILKFAEKGITPDNAVVIPVDARTSEQKLPWSAISLIVMAHRLDNLPIQGRMD